MTPVDFTFLAPDGTPVSNAEVDIQLLQAAINETAGILMPRPVTVYTDENGKVTVPLEASEIGYSVLIYDTVSDAQLSYKFYVPELTPPNTSVRLQDIIVDATTVSTQVPFDQAALLTIVDAKSNAVSAEIGAQNAETSAIAARDAALGYANNSADSANRAAAQAGLAAISRSGIDAAQAASQASATAADTSAKASVTSATLAGTQLGLATTQANNAATSASNAAGLATAARTSEVNAKTSETNAGNSAVAAAGSASAADSSKTAASNSANAASTSAQAADQSKQAAANSASASATSASAAAASQKTASDSAAASSNSATVSSGWANAAAGSANSAATSLTNATTQANTAKDWATKTSGEVVPGQGYGAQKYANDSASSAAASATSAGNAHTSEVNAAGSASAALASAGTAQARATDSTNSATASAASAQLAQDWATKTTAPVNGGMYGAAKYAADAAASASSAANALQGVMNGQVNADWGVTDPTSKAFIVNKPVIPAAQMQSDWNETNAASPDFIKNKPNATLRANYGAGGAGSVSSEYSSLRTMANPSTIGYSGGVRFRFGSANEVDAGNGYADIIDFSTYIDASGGGVNSLYLNKGGQYIQHKYALPGATAWTSIKTLAYKEDVLPLTGGTLSGGLSLGQGADLHMRATAAGDAGDIVFDNVDGTEKHRIWDAGDHLNYRYNGGNGYSLMHSGNVGSFALPIGGGMLNGNLWMGAGANFTSRDTVPHATIAAVTDAPIESAITTVPTGSASFTPMFRQRTILTGNGYIQNVVFGSYRPGTVEWGGAAFIGIGGADAGPTENFFFDYGGGIRHSNGTTFLNSGNVATYAVPVAPGGINLDWSAKDLNGCTKAGFYRGNAMPNAPDLGWWFVLVEAHDGNSAGNPGWTSQTATSYGSGNAPGLVYMRRQTGAATWSNWVQISDGGYGTEYVLKRRRNRYHADDGTSINNIVNPEMGFDYDTAGAGFGGPFLHFGGLSSYADYSCQIKASYGDGGNTFKFRTRNNDAAGAPWNAWKTVWHDGNLPVSHDAIANTVVLRDQYGYIYSNHISTLDDSNGGTGGTGNAQPVTAIMVKQGDNWHRGVNKDYVKNFLGISGLTVISAGDNANMNNYHVPGMYAIGASPTNGPNGATAYGTLLAIASADHDVTTHIYGDFNTSRLWTRTGNNWGSIWAPWRTLAWTDSDTFTNTTLVKPTIKGYIEQFQALNPGAAVTVNPDNGTLIELQATSAMTITLPAAVAGVSYTIIVYYQGAYGLTFTGGTSLHWAGGSAPAATSVSGKFDKYQFTCGGGYTLAQDGGRNF